MSADCLAQLRALLAQLHSAASLDEVSRLCKDLLKLGRRWPQKPQEQEAPAFERFSAQLMKFADSQQQDLVAAFRPLREALRQRMAESTNELNAWLGDERAPPQRLAELLTALEAPPLRWYRQCGDLAVKAHFLVAVAATARALARPPAPLRARADSKALTLLSRLAERFFVLPQHGDVLEAWHDARLEYYNATLWRAGKRAAERLKDDLQVRLVSALRRASPPGALSGAPRAKPQLQLELQRWPMATCPLARAFLDFVAQRGPELGDLGRPGLSDCPPHSLLPATLRRLLARLDAFEVVDDDAQGGVVRLRWEAVAALAFKAVGTKPKAASMAPAPAKAEPKPKPKPKPTPRRREEVGSLAGAAHLLKENGGRPNATSEDSSSASESSRSKRRAKRRRRDKRSLGLMGYGDYFGGRQGELHISPEVMMMNMNQMMGMSMMMNSPLAMMGMGAPILAHQMPLMQPSGMKLKKEDKAKWEKPEEKGPPQPARKELGRDRDPRKEKAMIDAGDL